MRRITAKLKKEIVQRFLAGESVEQLSLWLWDYYSHKGEGVIEDILRNAAIEAQRRLR